MKENQFKGMLMIGKVSKLTGLPKSTLQYYDEKDVLKPVRNPANNYRYYSMEDVEKLKQIKLLTNMGIGLDEIKETLAQPDFQIEAFLSNQISKLDQEQKKKEIQIGFAHAASLIGLCTEAMDSIPDDVERIRPLYSMQAAIENFSTELHTLAEEKGEIISQLFVDMSRLQNADAASEEAQKIAGQLYEIIESFIAPYLLRIFLMFGNMLTDNQLITQAIDTSCGENTALFIAETLRIFAERKEQETQNNNPVD